MPTRETPMFEMADFKLRRVPVMLIDYGFIAGGFVRDMIFGIPTGDIDLYVHTHTDVEAGLKEVEPYIVDVKKTDQSPETVIKGFYLSIDQVAFHPSKGVIYTPAFLRTVETGHVNVFNNIPNWDQVRGDKHPRFHYDKIKKKYPHFTWDSHPKKPDIDDFSYSNRGSS